ncbi:hypothetical protein PGAG_00114 [Phaeocystis globosa virus 12T]|uniref:Uncharacterized protein n=1 Tax=Phaeocystis globosa virus PgV-16T TaxID=3071227 RepID=A0AC59EWZ5_9VIRU|nr:hypothetical protein PGCG_00155 [Phaeocystis globosa virus]AET73003.1 hypothetical protein PGAG_00114 [Phaeocystis globosa virus 12T]AET73825.1 hypothetical protein PGBG_00117 [Phaeocystis globosa virus 14T]AGM15466.1 hypothetical protein PGCG_00155 [Phaeocystis globosa virus PgV-16T]UYE94196.1 hypothetical protein PGV14T_00155 [Phaeocystis globosa virus]
METDKLQKKDLELQSNKDILMYYQTSIRNVALTTAVSFAALGYSRFYRGKSSIYSSGLALVSLLIIAASCILNINLYNLMEQHARIDNSLTSANNYLIVNKIFMISHSMIILFGLYTFYRLITGKKFD